MSTAVLGDELIHLLFEAQVACTPVATALVVEHRRITYSELDSMANRVAVGLIRGSVTGLVGVCLGRNEWLPAALLGVLKAGCAYVPLDPAYPTRWHGYVAADAGLRTVVTSREHAALAEWAGAQTLLVEDLTSDEALRSDARPSDLAYVIYTSGSTGNPKGVLIEHRSVVNLLKSDAAMYSPDELAGVLASTSVCFDPSVTQLFLPLITGGTVILAEILLELPDLPARNEVTLINGVPSALDALLERPLPPSVRTILAGGEVLARGIADRILAQPSVRRLVNLYGPTECTTTCAAAEIRPGGGEPPIGVSYAGADLSIRDDAGQRIVDDSVGELWVGGVGVAAGYLGRPQLTAERFVVDPTVSGGRAYRTGDQVRMANGELQFVGRVDHQVKVRGFRIELGEIETALRDAPAVHTAVATTSGPDRAGERELLAFVTLHPDHDPVTGAELRSFLAGRVPAHLVPSRIGVLDRLPTMATGKVDRAALPRIDRSPPSTSVTAPRTSIESRIAGIVSEVTGNVAVGLSDRFVDLGGHSLGAARVVARVAAEFDVPVPLATFLADPTVAGLARHVLQRPTGGRPTRHLERSRFPLTDLQREMWTMRQVNPGVAASTVALRLSVTGCPDVRPLQITLDGLVRRHQALRTRFTDTPGGPVAEVCTPAAVPVVEHHAGDLTGVRQSAAIEAWVRLAAGHIFDLSSEIPLIRATVIWTGSAEVDLVVAVDHCAFDGYSTGLLLAELATGIDAALAGSPDPNPEPPLQVGDLAVFDRDLSADRGRSDALLDFWRSELSGATMPHQLSRRTASQRRNRGSRVRRSLEPALSERIVRVAAAANCTPFSVYLAALGVLIGAVTGEPDTVVGAASARRDRPGVETLIGPLVGVLPIRLPTAAASFQDLTRLAGAAVSRALAHQDIPVGEISQVCDGQRPAGAAFTPVLLTMQPVEAPVHVERGPVKVDLVGELSSGGSVCDLAFLVHRTVNGAEIQLEFDCDRFDAADAESLLALYVTLLTAAADAPTRQLTTIELVDPDQRAALIATGAGRRLADGTPTIIDAVLTQCRTAADAVAVTGTHGDMRYGELAEFSRRVATGLAALGVRPGDVVGACLPRDHRLPATLLGIWRAGAAYLPLDPALPAQRLQTVAREAGLRAILAASSTLPLADTLDAPAVWDVDGLPASRQSLPVPDPQGLAYVLYTSGSTGRPKGVEIRHANLAGFVAAMQVEPGFGRDDVMLAVTSLSFDVAGSELWVPLTVGARTVVVQREDATDAHRLADRISKTGVTVVDAPPILLRALLAAGWSGGPGIRVITGGETVDPALASDVLRLVKEIWNAYGPTETTINATLFRLPGPSEAAVPIGRPIAGAHAYVVDHLGRLLPSGIVGELWIGGPGVGRGYRGQPALTEASFVPDPFRPGENCYRTGDLVRWRPDGQLDFAGRRDTQVKIRGYRIELEEIESVLRGLPDVTDAAVTVHGEGTAVHLVGHLTPAAVDTRAVQTQLSRVLPDYMVPRRWVSTARLPTLVSGKVDRSALHDPGPGAGGTAPRTATEQLMAAVWAEVLGTVEVPVEADFFALGGHSFAATRVIGRLRNSLGCHVPVRVLFEHPALADFTGAVEVIALAQFARDGDPTLSEA